LFLVEKKHKRERERKEENHFDVDTHVASVNLYTYFQHKQSQRAESTNSQFSTLKETTRICQERQKRKREKISKEYPSPQRSNSLHEEDQFQFHSSHNSSESLNNEDERVHKRHKKKSSKKDVINQKNNKHK
jgi:hypothetical protein